MNFLRRPYPFYENAAQKAYIVLGLSVFMILFVEIFRPLGMDKMEQWNAWVPFGFGMTILVVESFNLFVLPATFPFIFKEDRWTVGKEILWVVWMIHTIALGSCVLLVLFYDATFNWNLVVFVTTTTWLLAIIPGVIITLIRERLISARNASHARQVNLTLSSKLPTNQDIITFIAENGKDQLVLALDSVLFIESSGNYVEIYYRDEQIVRKLLRNRLSVILQLLEPFPHFIRCHRTLIVNLERVERLSGNAQGYKMHLEGLDRLLPVARSRSKPVRKLLHSLRPI